VLALSGSRQMDKRKHRLSATVVREVPDAPPWLSEAGARHWARLAPLVLELGAVSRYDGDVMTLACEALAEYEACRKAIALDGETYAMSNGAICKHPLLTERSGAWMRALRALGQLGLTPPSREGRNPLPDEIIGGEDRDGGVELSV
jgi:P27 family predicted phage terminase small subunit